MNKLPTLISHWTNTATSRCFLAWNYQANSAISSRQVHTWSDLSPRDLASLEDQIWQTVGSEVFDPVLQKDIGSLKWLQRRIQVTNSKGPAKLTLRLPSLLHPSVQELQESVQRRATEELERWSAKRQFKLDAGIDVELSTSKPVPAMSRYGESDELLTQVGPGLINVSQYIAVYSCKGGVGKSTVAVNLAFELARMGGRVGLLDIDIYGPSLPILVQPDDPAVRPSPLGKGMIHPLYHRGVKLMSLGYVSPKSGVPGSGPNAGAAVMRGPMVGRVVTQLLKATDWGDLDVLILDLPPGTGDVQLAVCQELQLTGAVAVTTPSKLATEDTRKGIEMFTSLGVPTLAVVENMSYFVCEGGSTHYPFGQGLQVTPPGMGASSTFHPSTIQLPISLVTNEANDSGAPIALTRPPDAADELSAFEELAKTVSLELMLLRHKQLETSGLVTIDGVGFEVESMKCSIEPSGAAFVVRLYSDAGASQIRVPASHLRSLDPKTGELLPKESSAVGSLEEQSRDPVVTVHHARNQSKTEPRTTPCNIERKGRYGYAVEWGDGAIIIYSMGTFATAAVQANVATRQ